MTNEIPRRCILDEMTPAELAITNVKRDVENLGADTRLTEALNLLSDARDRVADFVDNVQPDTIGKIQKARNLALQLYELCKEDEVCAAIANMIWDADDPEDFAGESAEEFLHNVGTDRPCEMQAAFKLPNICGVLKEASPDASDDECTILWGDAA